MKTLFAFVLAAGTLCFAQTTSSNTTQGCLSGSDGSYSLRDSNGKSFTLTGDTASLKDHVGHTVKISGASDASKQSIKVESVAMVSESCTNSSAAATDPATDPNAPRTGSIDTSASNDTPASANTTSATSETRTNDAAAAASPSSEAQPAAEPAAPAATEVQPTTSASASTMNEQQTPPVDQPVTSPSTPPADQSATATASTANTTTEPAATATPDTTAAASTTTTTTSANENFYGQTQSTTPAQPASEPVATETAAVPATDTTASEPVVTAQNDSNAAVPQSDQAQAGQEKAASEQLPETASPLPLLGLLGFGATGLGLFLRRK